RISPIGSPNAERPDPREKTAVLLVNGFNGFGIHTLLSILRSFPETFKNVIFVSVAVVDSSIFKGANALDALKASVNGELEKYVELARKLGLAANQLNMNSPRPSSLKGSSPFAWRNFIIRSCTMRRPSPSNGACKDAGSPPRSCRCNLRFEIPAAAAAAEKQKGRGILVPALSAATGDLNLPGSVERAPDRLL